MATRCYRNVVFRCILVIVLVLTIINLIDADDKYRCPRNLGSNWYVRTHKDKCYEFVRTEMNWGDARRHCRRGGGELIIIDRRDIQAFVEQSLQLLHWNRNGVWIGATDSHDEEDWRWTNGKLVSSGFRNWDSGQPSCFLLEFMCLEDCACLRLDKGYKWHDYFCSSSGFEYGFICQYDMLPPTTTTSTTTSTSTTTTPTTTTPTSTTTTPTSTTTTPTSTTTKPPTTKPPTTSTTSTTTTMATTTTTTKTTAAPTSKMTEQPTTTQKVKPSKTTPTIETDTSHMNLTVAIITPGNLINVESQKLSSEETGIETGGIVGMVVSFVLVFIAGLIVGIFMCRRRRKRYEEAYSVGFNNVLYTGASGQPARLKETNILVVSGAANDSDLDDSEDHRYTDIDEITACGGAKCVDLPTCDEKAGNSSCQNTPVNEYCYNTVSQEDEPDEEEGGDLETAATPPCAGIPIKFAPDFLKKDTDVSQAYSNNLYSYHK